MFELLPATRPEARRRLVPLAAAALAHAAILAVASSLTLLSLPGPEAPPVPVRFFAAAPAAAPPAEAVEGEGGGEARRPRLFRAPPGAGGAPIVLPAPLRPAEAGPPAGAPDEGGTGVASADTASRPRPRRREGARQGEAAGERSGDLTGVAGGEGRALAPGEVLEVGGNVTAPEILEQIRPEYPPAALAERIQGTVVLGAIIDEEGRVLDVRVIHGPPALREAAAAALRQWRFRPGTLNGRPVKVSFTLNVKFVLVPPAADTAAGEATAARL